ncbi:unnamed protein product [Ilex paraguariensis]|uniref:Uncharacterized protein n=1 Tax=Ilex paraguariensis TaxID=185542 RepID=A0ABC8SP94_9AQUA
MGRGSNDHVSIDSSIALLQERFRQLQRVKQMREEREYLKMLSESEGCTNPTTSHEPSKLFFQSELILPQKPPSQVSLSLSPNTQIRHANFKATETTPQLTKSWLADTNLARPSSIKLDGSDSDVDTSLHL